MKHTLLYILLLVFVVSCRPRTDMPSSEFRTSQFVIDLPEKCQSIESARLTITDVNMAVAADYQGATLVDDTTAQTVLTVPVGYYDFRFEATVTTLDGNTYRVRAVSNRKTIESDATISLNAYALQKQDRDFVIAEVFFAGTLTPEGKQYNGDKYFVIVNTADSVLYADGLILMESKFKNSSKYILTPDIMSSAFAVDALYRIPGSGTQVPVEPGQALLIVDIAIDHRGANPNSFDLSSADFEWYDESTSPNVTDVDNPAVPNLEKIFCYTATIWVPHNQGATTFALGRLPEGMTDNEYLSNYEYRYKYINVTSAGTYQMSGSCYRFPNAWIIDAANMCPHSVQQWTAIHESIDAGWAYVSELGSDKSRYGLSVRRKNELVRDTMRLQDTNNSTEDFLHAQVANPFYFRP